MIKTQIYANIRKDVKNPLIVASSKSHLKLLAFMSIPNSSSFDFIIVNNEPYVGLCFLKSDARSCHGAASATFILSSSVARSCHGAASATFILSSSVARSCHGAASATFFTVF